MNKSFVIGFALGMLAEVVRVLATAHTRERRRMLWDLWILAPSFFSFSFMTGASVEWIKESNGQHMVEFGACIFAWVITLWIGMTIEKNGLFLEEVWREGRRAAHCRISAFAYGGAVAVGGVPYVLFSHVLGLEHYDTYWWVLVSWWLVATIGAVLLMGRVMCGHIDGRERASAIEVVRELMDAFIRDPVSPVKEDALDEMIAERRPAMHGTFERSMDIIEKTIFFISQFNVNTTKGELVPGLREIRLCSHEIEKIVLDESSRALARMRRRFFVLKVLVGPEGTVDEYVGKIRNNFPEVEGEIRRLLEMRESIKKSRPSK